MWWSPYRPTERGFPPPHTSPHPPSHTAHSPWRFAEHRQTMAAAANGMISIFHQIHDNTSDGPPELTPSLGSSNSYQERRSSKTTAGMASHPRSIVDDAVVRASAAGAAVMIVADHLPDHLQEVDARHLPVGAHSQELEVVLAVLTAIVADCPLLYTATLTLPMIIPRKLT
jgi:hypothetical protein